MTNLTKYNEMVLKYGRDVIDEVRNAVKQNDGNLTRTFDLFENQGMLEHAMCLDEYYFGK